MFVNANTLIYSTSKLVGAAIGSSLITAEVGYKVSIQRNVHFIYGGTALITAFGEGRFKRRLKKLQHLGF